MNKITADGQLTAERLRELFFYNPDTGIFTRRRAIGNVKAGKICASRDTAGHIHFRVDKRMYSGHRLAWLYMNGDWPEHHIDHINGIRDDNRISNLRDVTPNVNAQNIKKPRAHSKTGLLGVSWKHACKKYVAQIQVDGKVRHLGLFDDPNEAHEVYLQEKRKHHPGCTI